MPSSLDQACNVWIQSFSFGDIFTSPTAVPKKQCYMQVAEDASLSVSGAGQRAEALRESLAGELEQARAIAQAAQAARQKANEDIVRAQSSLKELKEQEEAQKVGIFISICDRQGKLPLLRTKVAVRTGYESHQNGILFRGRVLTCYTYLRGSVCEVSGCTACLYFHLKHSFSQRTGDWCAGL